MTDSITLRCREAYTRDVGRGHLRIDYETMDKLGIVTGDIVEIEGKKKSVAKALPLYPSDEGKGMARTDGLIRDNMKLVIDEYIKIKKITSQVAKLIIVKAVDTMPPIDERYLTDAFEGTPMSIDDCIMVPYFGGRIKLQVVKTDPEGAVAVTRNTIFVIDDKEKDDKNKKITCPTCGSLV